MCGRQARFINMFGTTETSGIVAKYEIPADFRYGERTDVVPIGHPIPGAELHILDDRRQPVPEGEVGALHVGGPGVSRGYLGSAEHTDRAFSQDHLSACPGTLLYRTGDLVRRRNDGVIEHCGRADGQLNIRGCRIEPREMELFLNRHPAVERVRGGGPHLPGCAEPDRLLRGEGESTSRCHRVAAVSAAFCSRADGAFLLLPPGRAAPLTGTARSIATACPIRLQTGAMKATPPSPAAGWSGTCWPSGPRCWISRGCGSL